MFSDKGAWEKGPRIAEGKDMERAALGVPKNVGDGSYMEFKEAVDFIKNQDQPLPFDRPRIAKELRKYVAELCAKNPSGNDSEPVRFYTAINSPLDTYHGVDAFFEQGNRRVTLDITMHAKDNFKADVVLIASLDEEGIPVVDDVEFERVANEIAEKLIEH